MKDEFLFRFNYKHDTKKEGYSSRIQMKRELVRSNIVSLQDMAEVESYTLISSGDKSELGLC